MVWPGSTVLPLDGSELLTTVTCAGTTACSVAQLPQTGPSPPLAATWLPTRPVAAASTVAW